MYLSERLGLSARGLGFRRGAGRWVRRICQQATDRLPNHRPKATLLRSVDGSSCGGDILCLFSSFDRNSEVPNYVDAYIRELKSQGCDTCFVSTSPDLPSSVIERLEPSCYRTIHRRNRGLDFASWKLGADLIGSMKGYRGVLLANDSMLGPLRSLEWEFEQIRRPDAVVIGMTDSNEYARHLQSYFIYLPMTIFQSPPFQAFWNRIAVLADKGRIIRDYEVGLSRHLASHGVMLRALYPFDELLTRARSKGSAFEFHQRLQSGLQINPTLHYWEILVREMDFPFVKRGNFTASAICMERSDRFIAELSDRYGERGSQVAGYLRNLWNYYPRGAAGE